MDNALFMKNAFEFLRETIHISDHREIECMYAYMILNYFEKLHLSTYGQIKVPHIAHYYNIINIYYLNNF